ncbi:hypothetical protein AB3S75_026209 [Citrus x aurantiifolia]
MAKFSVSHFFITILVLVSVGTMMPAMAKQQQCTEMLPWVKFYCLEKGAVSETCWGNCTQRHPDLILAYCGGTGALPIRFCACVYPC